MSESLKDRLRASVPKRGGNCTYESEQIRLEAADHIESLEREIADTTVTVKAGKLAYEAEIARLTEGAIEGWAERDEADGVWFWSEHSDTLQPEGAPRARLQILSPPTQTPTGEEM